MKIENENYEIVRKTYEYSEDTIFVYDKGEYYMLCQAQDEKGGFDKCSLDSGDYFLNAKLAKAIELFKSEVRRQLKKGELK